MQQNLPSSICIINGDPLSFEESHFLGFQEISHGKVQSWLLFNYLIIILSSSEQCAP